MQHEKILDQLNSLPDYPWSFTAPEDGCSAALRGEVSDKHGNSIFWLSTEVLTSWRAAKSDLKSVKLLTGEFIAAAPALIEKLLEEIDQLKEIISQGKKLCKTNARTAKRIPRNS